MNGFDLGYAALGVATWPWWRRRARGGWAERFGRVLPELPSKQQGKPRVLLHAVSVGETASLRTLVPMLVDRGAEVIVTATTDTGLARAHELYDGVAHVCRFPLDGSWIVRKFLDAVQPDVVGLVELEVWPNFVAACAQRRIPVGVISGRLSERSFRGYRRAKPIVGRAFRQLAFASAQDEAYCERFRAMG
ncbi:MAG: glycosyltransferase N-terminal domain-containing protein [Planctomycetota bacterium]